MLTSAVNDSHFLDVDGLSVKYGSITALKSVSLHVNRGEIVALVGRNGAGKSTLLGTVSGLTRPVSGRVVFEGQSLTGRVPEQIVARGIALVPEGRRIFGTLSVAENLSLGATLRRGESDMGMDMSAVLELFPILRARLKSVAGRLSGGEQQQLAIARALLSRPKLLLLDEPSLGLAPQIVDQVYRVLMDLHGRAVTILLVEQKVTKALAIADRVYVLRSGNVVFTGPAHDALRRADLEAAYFGYQINEEHAR